jgi:hypothetical protein
MIGYFNESGATVRHLACLCPDYFGTIEGLMSSFESCHAANKVGPNTD